MADEKYCCVPHPTIRLADALLPSGTLFLRQDLLGLHGSIIAALELSTDSMCACSEILGKRNSDYAGTCSGIVCFASSLPFTPCCFLFFLCFASPHVRKRVKAGAVLGPSFTKGKSQDL